MNSRLWTLVLAGAAMLLPASSGAATATTTYLSDKAWTSAANGWGPVELDRSNGENVAGDGRTITLNGVTYAKGLGGHAASDVRYGLAAACSAFTAVVGVDDEVGANGSVVFQVWADGVKRYDSGLMTGAMAGKAVSVDITGVSQLALVITDGGDGVDSDHGDWADAKVSCGSTTTSSSTLTTFLSDRLWNSATNGWGPVELDRSNGQNVAGDGTTITLNALTYARGLGAHAPSDIRYALSGACSLLTAIVGVDDEVGSNGSVVFQVWADGVQRYDSGVMTGAMAGKAVSVNLTGANQIDLIITDGGDGIDSDHGDWANAQVTCATGTSTSSLPSAAPAPATAVRMIPPGEGASTASVTITPASLTVAPGATQQFSAAVSGTANTQVTWTATGGSITSTGAFTAPSTAGGYKVVATISGGTINASAPVSVTSATTAIAISPGQNIQAAIDAAPAGTAFLLKSGVHRMQTIRPKDKDTISGENGTVLSGARVITNWVQDGADWKATGQTQENPRHPDAQCLPSAPRCRYPEDLFMDNAFLTHVDSRSALGPGKWFFDYAADTIYMRDNPASHLMEASVTNVAIAGTSIGVTVQSLTVEKFANMAQTGAIDGSGTNAWTVSNCELRLNHGAGIDVGSSMLVLNNNMHDNGQEAIHIGGIVRSGILVEGNEIAYNNRVGFEPGWEAGGTKFALTDGLIVRRNWAHHNAGPGLWTDVDNINTTYEYNIAEDNFAPAGSTAAAAGIFHEISYSGVIRYNTVRRNGTGFDAWGWGAGILVAASGGTSLEIYGNTLDGNKDGIMLIQQNRGSGLYGTHLVQNVFVHDNTVTMAEGWTGAVQDIGDQSIYTTRNNRFANNTYYLGPNSTYFVWMDKEQTESGWKSYGQDTNGSFVR